MFVLWRSYGTNVDKSKFPQDTLYTVLAVGNCASAALPKPTSTINFTEVAFFGLGLNGGYAQYAAVDQATLVPVVRILTARAI